MRLLSDFAWAVATIWQESRGEPYAGKIAVGNVIRNRCGLRARTVAEVVLAPYQFSGWMTTDPNRVPAALIEDTDPVVKDCADAWLASEKTALVGNATLYANLDIVKPDWLARVAKVAQIGHHTFFSE